MGKLRLSVDSLFDSDQQTPTETAEKYLDKLSENYQSTKRKVYRRFVSILFIWLAMLAFSMGGVKELSVFGVKIGDFTLILVTLPAFSAVILYGLFMSFSGMMLYLSFIRYLIYNIWPKLAKEGLSDLLLPESSFFVEIFIGEHINGFWYKVDKGIQITGFFILFITPTVLVIHIHYMAIQIANVPSWIFIAIACISSILVFRGVSLSFHSSDKID